MENPIPSYLEDVIAAEKTFETQLQGFASEANDAEINAMFLQHAGETRAQYEALTARLNAIGGNPSTLKGWLAHFFGSSPKIAQIGHETGERTTQNLIMAFSVETAEVAMYEALRVTAEEMHDPETAELATAIQAQEAETGQKVWGFNGPAVVKALETTERAEGRSGRDILTRYVQDTEAAERNFEDALATFSKSGGQQDVQDLMAMMSRKAKTQHERLEARLKALGGERSAGKSFLAHILAFTPVTAQLGHHAAEKSTQHLIITCAAAGAETAMYEALASVAESLQDSETATLARQLQAEEKEDYRLASGLLPSSARRALATLLTKQ